ncbi:Multiprotein bridging factor 1 [Chondrus crispus]|uniref:Multiprotein bridging factor 1 n=1 Tax=Chondrus crispus TaxID=2769 RepID=R7Q831_CHOCR|nr:Multiprotein bridging factor 1 [Chondrus crispus]CDF34194.1 Multiprotein bridging factor 1 [Chondrus crispus]|eukprot:XP_005714013.1 Multiprotein bridging factor 1 [Chondrus crispus]
MDSHNQDWSRVVMRSKNPSGSRKLESGPGSSAERKFTAGSNTKASGDSSMAKLDAETDVLAHKKVGLGLGKAIQQARSAKGMTQAKLAQAINEKPAVVNTYENGKAIPNGQIIVKMERALGTKLPRPSKKK